jgi:hypothetical protein
VNKAAPAAEQVGAAVVTDSVKVLTAKQAAAAKSKARALKPKEEPVCPFDTSFIVECLEKLTPLPQVCSLL